MDKGTGNGLVTGEATVCLSQIIPLESLIIYVRLYRVLRAIEAKLKHHLDIEIDTELDRVEKALHCLVRKGWLTTDQAITNYKALLTDMGENDNLNVVHLHVSHALRKRGAPRQNRPLDVLIYALINDVLFYSKTPCYSKVIDFLTEQGLLQSESYNEEDLRKRYSRLSMDEMQHLLFLYLAVDVDYFSENLIPAEAANLPPLGFLRGWIELYALQAETNPELVAQYIRAMLSSTDWNRSTNRTLKK